MLRYGPYIFGGDDSLYVVIDDGVSLVPQPDRPECQMRVSRHRGLCFPSFQHRRAMLPTGDACHRASKTGAKYLAANLGDGWYLALCTASPADCTRL